MSVKSKYSFQFARFSFLAEVINFCTLALEDGSFQNFLTLRLIKTKKNPIQPPSDERNHSQFRTMRARSEKLSHSAYDVLLPRYCMNINAFFQSF